MALSYWMPVLPLGGEDHHADGAGQSALAPVSQDLAGGYGFFSSKDRFQSGQQMPAVGGAIGIELRTAQQVQS